MSHSGVDRVNAACQKLLKLTVSYVLFRFVLCWLASSRHTFQLCVKFNKDGLTPHKISFKSKMFSLSLIHISGDYFRARSTKLELS